MSDIRYHPTAFLAGVEFDFGARFAAGLAATISALTQLPSEGDLKAMRALLRALEGIRAGLSPTAEDLVSAPLLSHWRFLVAPDGLRLSGSVIKHPVLGVRTRIATSPVYAVDSEPQRAWARTWNRFYRLGPAHTGAHTNDRAEKLH